MFSFKKKYFLIIENIKDIDLSNIKNINKFIIIYRNKKKIKNLHQLLKFRQVCKAKKIDLFIANDFKLMTTLKADGLYISAHNNNLKLNRYKKTKYKVIGSAHNLKELNIKTLQGCKYLIFSRLFPTNYKEKRGNLGIVKFNLFKLTRKENLIPLGGIKLSNLNKLSIVNSNAFALMSEIKKKPTEIFSRLF